MELTVHLWYLVLVLVLSACLTFLIQKEYILRRKIYYHEYQILQLKSEIEKKENTSGNAIQRAVIRGQIAEQIAAFLPNFPFHPADYRHLGGQPLDFIAFSGLHRDDNHIDVVVIGDIKYGGASLSPRQQAIKAAIDAGRVRWQTITVEPELTVKQKALRKGDTR